MKKDHSGHILSGIIEDLMKMPKPAGASAQPKHLKVEIIGHEGSPSEEAAESPEFEHAEDPMHSDEHGGHDDGMEIDNEGPFGKGMIESMLSTKPSHSFGKGRKK